MIETLTPGTPCIYCGAPALSAEHWLPRGFGAIKGVTLLNGRICAECNHALGRSLDEELLRTGPTGFFRSLLGIKGRRQHRDVSLFHYKAASAEQPTTMMMPVHHDGGYRILAQAYQPQHAKPLRQLVFKTRGGQHECVPFSRGWNADQLKQAIQVRNLQDAELVEVFLDDDESPEDDDWIEVRKVLTAALGHFGATAWYGKGDSTLRRNELKMGISRAYLRATVKVAFHYFLWASPLFRGDEPEFADVRRFILADEGDWHAFIRPVSEQFIPGIRDGLVPTEPSHFLLADVKSDDVTVRLQFFVGTHGVPPPSFIRLGACPSRLGARWLRCHRVWYYGEKRDGYDGELEAVEVTPRPVMLAGGE